MYFNMLIVDPSTTCSTVYLSHILSGGSAKWLVQKMVEAINLAESRNPKDFTGYLSNTERLRGPEEDRLKLAPTCSYLPQMNNKTELHGYAGPRLVGYKLHQFAFLMFTTFSDDDNTPELFGFQSVFPDGTYNLKNHTFVKMWVIEAKTFCKNIRNLCKEHGVDLPKGW